MTAWDHPSIEAMRTDPDYRDGFDDALAGWPLHLGMSTPYVEGWLAAQECRALFEHGTRGTVRQDFHDWKAGT